jgi:bifunctional non-homologous end joining protein LigD
MRKPSAAARVRLSMPSFVEPCLATLVAEPPEGPHWAHEIKFDGYRLQARIEDGQVRLLTRSGLDWTEKFGTLEQSLGTLKVTSAIIDGEVIVYDDKGASSFVELVSELKAKQSARMVFFAFDLMFLNGEDLRAQTLADRKALLKRLLGRRKKDDSVRFSDHVRGHGPTMLAEACQLMLEGIISKRLDKPYRSGRGTEWLKAKCIQTDEFVVIGYLDSKPVKNAIGALVLGFYEGRKLVYAGRVGTGFSNALARELWQQLQPLRTTAPDLATAVASAQRRGVVWVKPLLVAQVEYRAWTSDGLLRHAAFKALRHDKPARQVVDPRK